VTDESQLQVRPRDSDSSLTISKVRSSLIARGRRDAAILARRSSPEPTDALSETRRLAEQGDAEAQGSLGYAYHRGNGVPRDYAEAVKWFSKAAEQGDFDAREMLLLEFPQDYAEAATKWRREAAEQGYAEAQYILATAYRTGSGVLQDYAEAAKWFRKAAEQGHADAQYNLANAYYYGQGLPEDYAEAAKWFRKAAEQGHAEAQECVGFLCYQGQGVPQDYVEAAKWYRKAAQQGHVNAQHNLGVLCYDAQGTPQDYVQAHMWMDLAAYASTGDDRNKYSSRRDAIAAKMTPQQLAEAQQLAREWRVKLPK
jgi:TPR repeat protein